MVTALCVEADTCPAQDWTPACTFAQETTRACISPHRLSGSGRRQSSQPVPRRTDRVRTTPYTGPPRATGLCLNPSRPGPELHGIPSLCAPSIRIACSSRRTEHRQLSHVKTRHAPSFFCDRVEVARSKNNSVCGRDCEVIRFRGRGPLHVQKGGRRAPVGSDGDVLVSGLTYWRRKSSVANGTGMPNHCVLSCTRAQNCAFQLDAAADLESFVPLLRLPFLEELEVLEHEEALLGVSDLVLELLEPIQQIQVAAAARLSIRVRVVEPFTVAPRCKSLLQRQRSHASLPALCMHIWVGTGQIRRKSANPERAAAL
eukprot:3649478-Rhodomonas_salina.4